MKFNRYQSTGEKSPIFVDRKNEADRIVRAIKRKHNVIVTGRYGIGRTSLIKYIANQAHDQWHFVFADFSKTPGKVCDQLLADLWPEKRHREGGRYRRYKSGRFLIAQLDKNNKRPMVIVLDNIVKLSPQKMAFIRYLSLEKHFLFIAITEAFIPKNDLFLLRAQLIPVELVQLQHLDLESSCDLLAQFSKRYRFNWTESEIRMLAEITGGYPLGMKELLKRTLERSPLESNL
jgi:hypothetical protein